MPYAIEGLEQTLKALRKFSPDIYKEMNNEIRPELRRITDNAKSKLPFKIDGLSKFKYYATKSESKRKFPIYNTADARKGITFSMGRQKANRSGWVNRYVIWNQSAAGAIIETAGRRNPDGRAAAMSLMLKEYGGIQGITYKAKGGSRKKAGYTPDSKGYYSNNPFAGYHFVHSIGDQLPMKSVGRGMKNRGRVIFAAVEEDQGKAKAAIERAVNKAVAIAMSSITGRAA